MSIIRNHGHAYDKHGLRVNEIKTLDDAIDMLNLCAERMDGYEDCWRLTDRMAEVDVVREFLEALKEG